MHELGQIKKIPAQWLLEKCAIWLPILLLVSAVLIRTESVDAYFARVLEECDNCIRGHVVRHDLLIVLIVMTFHMTGLLVRSWMLSSFLRLAAMLVILLYLVDLVIFDIFSVRLKIFRFGEIGQELIAVWSVFSAHLFDQKKWFLALTWVGLAFTIALSFVRVMSLHRSLYMKIITGVMAVCSLYILPDTGVSTFSWVYRNVLEIQKQNTAVVDYSQQFINNFISRSPSPLIQCQPGLATRRNIILVQIESLSAHQSKYFSGLNNWLPRIDDIAQANYSFTNFYANGFSTAEGMVAMLTGHDPLPHGNGRHYKRWLGVSSALPLLLKSAGYHSVLLTNGDLSFLNGRIFFESIGFDVLEDNKHEWYAKSEKYHWDVPPDDMLYSRAINWVSAQKVGKPYFLFLSTMSTHQPYLSPRTGVRTQEAVVRYADDTFADFYEALTRSGFFDNGILLLTGDHRTMTPISAHEWKIFGHSAPARIPLVIVGAGIRSGIERFPFQQADIPSSLSYFVADQACFTDRQRNILKPPSEVVDSRCILHARGDEVDKVDVFCGDQHGRVHLNGDNTSAIEGNVPRNVLDDIHRARIGWFQRKYFDGKLVYSYPDEFHETIRIGP